MTEPDTRSHFAAFLPAADDNHCEFCARRLRFGLCPHCDPDD